MFGQTFGIFIWCGDPTHPDAPNQDSQNNFFLPFVLLFSKIIKSLAFEAIIIVLNIWCVYN